MAFFRFLPTVTLAVFLGAAPLAAQLSTAGNQLWRQGFDGILDSSDENDRFGSALAAGDFNGDGWDDLAIGVLGENDARGIVNVIYGGPGGLTFAGNQLWEQGVGGIDGNAERNDLFGVAVAAGDFNGDGFDDLVVGASGEDSGRGIVQAIYGSANGLTSQGNRAWRQGNDGIRDSAENNDAFGFSLAVGDFNGDGFDDVAAGGPGENNSEGLVIVIFGSSGGLTSNGNQRWREGDDGLRGDGEVGDLFGYELAAGDFNGDGFDDLAVGTPGENTQRGTANIIYGSSGGLTSNGNVRRQQGDDGLPEDDQDGDGFAEVMAAGDFNNDGYADLAVSALGDRGGRGTVIVIPGSSGGLTGSGSQLLHQGLFNEDLESGDRFGSSLAAGDFNGDGILDLAIGVRGEDSNRGVAHTIYGTAGGLSPDRIPPQVFAQGASGLLDQAEASDDFGWDLAAGNFGADFAADLAVGAPGEDNDRGVVHVLFGGVEQPAPVVSAIVGGGLSVPAVNAASYNSIVSVFGDHFVSAASAALRPGASQQAMGATMIDGVCVEMAGRRAPLFAVTPQQINAQAAVTPGVNNVAVEVIVNCDQPNALRSAAFNLSVAPASPEFFFFVYNGNGVNPIAAVHEPSGAYVGAPGLIPGAAFEPARPNDVVTVYLTGLGETTPPWQPGEFPTGASNANLPVSIQVGGTDVETIYAGVTPGFFGLYQASFRIPANAQAGNLPVRVTVGGAATPAGGFLTVAP